MVIIVIGTDGVGKSTVGRALADTLGWVFVDGDDHRDGTHAPRDRSLRSSRAVSEESRLRELHDIIERVMARREHLVLACTASKAVERDTLQGELRPVRFICLKAPRAELEARLIRHSGHAIDTARLHRQLLDFEDPGDQAIVMDGTKEPDILVPMIRRELGL